jgi:hypothetical protein
MKKDKSKLDNQIIEEMDILVSKLERKYECDIYYNIDEIKYYE